MKKEPMTYEKLLSKNKKLNFVKYALLERLTDIGINTNDPEIFEYTEELRELISGFSDNKLQEKE